MCFTKALGQRGKVLPGLIGGEWCEIWGREDGVHFRTISPTPGMAAKRLSGPKVRGERKVQDMLILSHALIVIT